MIKFIKKFFNNINSNNKKVYDFYINNIILKLNIYHSKDNENYIFYSDYYGEVYFSYNKINNVLLCNNDYVFRPLNEIFKLNKEQIQQFLKKTSKKYLKIKNVMIVNESSTNLRGLFLLNVKN
jgi:hypothetical protein